MKCKEITDGEFWFETRDEKACGWCDCGIVCCENILNKGVGIEL